MIPAPQPKILLSIKATDTTIIHRGGLTGLWMSLKVLEKKYPNPTKRPGNVTWNLTATSISLDWQGEDFPVLNWLIQQCFQNKKSQQRAIFDVQDFTITPQAIKDYQFICQQFAKNSIFKEEKKSFIVKINLIRSIIANNLALNLPWWTDFWESIYEANPLGDIEEQLAFNRKGLCAMIEQDTELEIYQNFIRAFHEALRKIYAKTYDEKKSKKENQSRIEKKYESIRSELTRCYDQQSLEDVISDLISRAGWNGELRKIWTPILPLIFQDIFWQKTRNLALIALASYQPQ